MPKPSEIQVIYLFYEYLALETFSETYPKYSKSSAETHRN